MACRNIWMYASLDTRADMPQQAKWWSACRSNGCEMWTADTVVHEHLDNEIALLIAAL